MWKKEAGVKLRQKNGLIPLTGKNKNVITISGKERRAISSVGRAPDF